MKRTFLLLMATIIIASYSLRAQVSINADGFDPDASAMLDVKSNDKGMLVPRMTTEQRIAINTPATGLLVFDITTGSFWFYNNGWTDLSAADGAWTVTGNNISSPNTGNVGIGTTTPKALLHLWGNGTNGAGTRLVFGDDLNTSTSTRAYIAEWGWQTNTDSDILELSAYEGIKCTSGNRSVFSELTDMEIAEGHNVGIGTVSGPKPSAKLDVESTSQGFLPPRMTAGQGSAISSPATGLIIYQTNGIPGYYYYTGTNWIGLTGIGPGAISTSSCIDYDGNAYPTFTIGNQVWMAENLRVTHYRDGTAISNVWAAFFYGAYCWYDNDQSANEKYGALYNWFAVRASRGLCPAGWHVPTDAEWTTLTDFLGGTNIAGGKMKANSDLWNSNNDDATNISNFSGLPGGQRYYVGGFDENGYYGNWWSYPEGDSTVWCRRLSTYNGNVSVYDGSMKDGYSVRCLRD